MAFTLKEIAEMSMGDQVARMNALFTRKMGDAPAGSKNAINQHIYTVSEFEETKAALNHGYVSDELRDGIADMFTTAIGSVWRAGITDSFVYNATAEMVAYQQTGSQSNLTTEAAKHYIETIETRVYDIQKILSLQGELAISDELFADLLESTLQLLFQYAVFIGVNPHADLSRVTLANLSKLCQGQDCLDRTYAKYKEIGVELYHDEVEPNVFAVFCKGTQLGTDGKTYDADKFLKSADWFEPFFDSLTTDSALAQAAVSAATIQATPKARLVDENGQPLI